MLPRALARLSWALNRACWAVRTVVKSVMPSRYCSTARSRERSGGLGALPQKPGLLLGPQEGDQVILHLLLGAEDGVLISDEQLLEPGVLDPHQVGDLAVIEDIPLHRAGRWSPAGCAS